MDLGANLLNDFLVQNQPVWPKEEAQCQSAAIQPFIDSATNFDSDLLDDDLLLFLPTDVKYSLNEQISGKHIMSYQIYMIFITEITNFQMNLQIRTSMVLLIRAQWLWMR